MLGIEMHFDVIVKYPTLACNFISLAIGYKYVIAQHSLCMNHSGNFCVDAVFVTIYSNSPVSVKGYLRISVECIRHKNRMQAFFVHNDQCNYSKAWLLRRVHAAVRLYY